MSETSNQALVDALVKFQRWCDGGGLDYEAALAAATKRAEEAEQEAGRAWREVMAIKDAVKTPDKLFASQLECVAADAVRELSTKLAAAEQENARLREGIEATINYVRTGVHCRMIDHKMDSCDCEKICDEFAALLAQPKGGPDA
jgi:hypothetical protein